MALLTFPSSETQKVQPTKRRRKHQQQNPKQKQQHHPSSSWDQIKNLLTCKQMDVVGSNKVKDPNEYSKLSACRSICSFKDVVHGNTRVVDSTENSPESSTVGHNSGLLISRKKPALRNGGSLGAGSVRSNGHGSYTSSSRGMQLRKLSGCYECHAIVDPARQTIPRTTICVCSECGEVFPKMESLEHHQAIRHAVSELGPEDSGRNIVEIIFKSSWLNMDHPIITIERILKVHNSRRTIKRFEDCRDAVKIRATTTTAAAASRCAADGNELLRFHCTTLACSLGSHGSSSLCGSFPGCGVCTIIRHGFQAPKSAAIGAGTKGVRTTDSSGRAHDCHGGGACMRKAMLVCRVIAGKVKRVGENAPPQEDGPYDSASGSNGSYSNLEELYVYNPRAILPCFVVIYEAVER